ARVLDEAQFWQQKLRENSDSGVRQQFNQWQAMLECQASLTTALGYRDLKPAVVGTCSLPDTELEGRYQHLLQNLRTNWTNSLGQQAVQAVQTLRRHIDTLEGSLSRMVPQFDSEVRPLHLDDIRATLQPDEALVEFVSYAKPDGGNPKK